MSSHNYLVRQASTRTYFFRSYIPQNLTKYFDGRQEFRLSLGCKSKIRSRLASNHLSDIVRELYNSIQSGAADMTLEEIKHILRIELGPVIK